MTKKICVITGTRAEYGLLSPLIQKIKENASFELQILVTGMHLSPEFGLTYQEIENDGFVINEKVEMLLSSDSDVGIAKSTGLGVMGVAESLNRLVPDMVIVLGDRFETLSAVIAAYILKIPLAHLHGGETTEGAFDEGFRHSITKMSYLHFTSTELYRKRVVQLGESPERVYNVGAIGIDNIKQIKLLSRDELEKEIKFSLGEKSALITFHPVTLDNASAETQFGRLLSALEKIEGVRYIFTKPNADTGGRGIIKLIDEFVEKHGGKAIAYTSLGQKRYLSAISHVDVVIGNSSSGIIEVPSLGKPTVNIGNRQKGRVKAKSVIDCEPETDSIVNAMNKALTGEFKELCQNVDNPYGEGNTSDRIFAIIKKEIGNIDLRKSFYDIQ